MIGIMISIKIVMMRRMINDHHVDEEEDRHDQHHEHDEQDEDNDTVL